MINTPAIVSLALTEALDRMPAIHIPKYDGHRNLFTGEPHSHAREKARRVRQRERDAK